MHIDRILAATLGAETVKILADGSYTAVSGQEVSIADDVRRAVIGTETYPPDRAVSSHSTPSKTGNDPETIVRVVNQTTLAAAREMYDAGIYPLALNFASAKNPGGGFLSGARAQEESLARSSALVSCLRGNPMYQHHRGQRDARYTDYAIYSPDVPVLRGENHQLLDSPFYCSFITCAAVNAKAVRRNGAIQHDSILSMMKSRICKVLKIAIRHNHSSIILGAWGCGAFGNRAVDISRLFADAINEEFTDCFREIVFAITDWSDEKRFIGPFQDVFDR